MGAKTGVPKSPVGGRREGRSGPWELCRPPHSDSYLDQRVLPGQAGSEQMLTDE